MSDTKSFKTSIADIKLAYNIVDYIQQSGVKLKQNGATKWKGLCVFHNEKSPSFSVDEHFQNYHCFGCGASGDIISFVEQTESLDFFEALKKLAEDKNINLDIENIESSVDYKSLRACIKSAANFYLQEFKKLPEEHPAKKQVLERGLSLRKTRYGYSPEGRQTLYKHLSAEGFSDEVILQTGVCLKFDNQPQPFDFWNGRLMFFITDITGRPVGFSARKLYDTDKRGKYVNSPDGPLFDKSSVLYNISVAKKEISATKDILVVEGQFDVSAYIEADMTNVVASSGTAFTEKQAMVARRIVTEEGRIIFCFDGDKAGSAAAEKVFKSVPIIHSQAYVVSFPEGQDPCDYRLEHGNEALKEYTLKSARPMIEFVLDIAKKDYDLDSSVDRSRYLEKAAKILKTVSNLSLRESYTKKVALDSFTSIDIVKAAVNNAEGLDSTNYSTKEEVKAETRPKMTEEEFDLEEVLLKIEKDEVYEISARLIALTLMQPDFALALKKVIKYFPEDLQKFAVELSENVGSGSLIPEMFDNTDLARELISRNFFAFAHLMDLESCKRQFVYLRNRLREDLHERAADKVRIDISKLLDSSGKNDSRFLEKAIRHEDNEIAKIKEVLK